MIKVELNIMDILSTWDSYPIIAPGYILLECRLWSVFDMLPRLLIEYDWYLQSATPMTKKACLIIQVLVSFYEHRSYLRAPTTSIYINLGIKEEKSIKMIILMRVLFVLSIHEHLKTSFLRDGNETCIALGLKVVATLL